MIYAKVKSIDGNQLLAITIKNGSSELFPVQNRGEKIVSTYLRFIRIAALGIPINLRAMALPEDWGPPASDVAIPLLEIPKLFNLYIEEVHKASNSEGESKNKGKSKMIDEGNNSKDVEMSNCEEEYMDESQEKDNENYGMVEDKGQDEVDDPNSSREALEAIDVAHAAHAAQAKAANNTTNNATNNETNNTDTVWRITFPPLVLDNLANAFSFESEGDIRLFWAAMYRVTHRVVKLEDLAEEMARNAMLLRFGELCHARHSLTFAEVFPFYKVHFILQLHKPSS